MIALIARHEFTSQLRNPALWLILAAMQILFAWLFLVALEEYLASPPSGGAGLTAHLLAQYLAPVAGLLLLVTPLLTMRLISEELASGSFRLLQSAPVPMGAVALGKFLGLLGIELLLIALAFVAPLLLSAVGGTPLDWGALAAAALGLALLGAACAACGLYFSCLTAQPSVAALGALGLLLLLWLLDNAPTAGGSDWLRQLAPPAHLNGFLRGLVDSGDVAYFSLFAAYFLALAARRLDNLRLIGE